MKFSITDFFSKYDQIPRKLRIWSHLLKKSAMENFIFCAVSTQVFLLLDFAMCMYNLHAWSQEKYFLAQFNLTRGYGYITPFPSFFNATLARPMETPGKVWLLFKIFPLFSTNIEQNSSYFFAIPDFRSSFFLILSEFERID